MTQQNPAPPIRSKAERARTQADSAPSPSVSNGASPEEGDSDSLILDEIRESARSIGYEVRKEPRARRPRPEARDGRIPTTCRIHPEIRDAMDRARLELNMNFSDMINAGVVMFLRSRNLGIDVEPEQFLPS